eukprot:scaffold63882_cov60-Phaeocystis_antarctica.AAC.1
MQPAAARAAGTPLALPPTATLHTGIVTALYNTTSTYLYIYTTNVYNIYGAARVKSAAHSLRLPSLPPRPWPHHAAHRGRSRKRLPQCARARAGGCAAGQSRPRAAAEKSGDTGLRSPTPRARSSSSSENAPTAPPPLAVSTP